MADSNPKPVQKPQELYKVGDRVRLNSKANELYNFAHEGTEGVITNVRPAGQVRFAQYNLEFDFTTMKVPQGLEGDTRFWQISHDCCEKIADAGEVQGKTEKDSGLLDEICEDDAQEETRRPEHVYGLKTRIRLNSKANEIYQITREGSVGVIVGFWTSPGQSPGTNPVYHYRVKFSMVTGECLDEKLMKGARFREIWDVCVDCCEKIADAGEVQGKQEDKELEGLVASEQTQAGDKPTTEPVVKTYLL